MIIEYGTIDVYIDLAAERLIAAEKGNERIAIEVKSFLGPSLVADFHTALGQFLNYRLILDGKDPDRVLYLAVPKPTFPRSSCSCCRKPRSSVMVFT